MNNMKTEVKYKGVRDRGNGRYQAYFSFSSGGKTVNKVVGTYGSAKEAKENRDKFIDSLK